MKHIVSKLLIGAAVAALATASHALPVFFTFESGTADIASFGSAMLVTSSVDAVINWQSFDITAGETVTFKGLNPGLSTWNRVIGGLPMLIAGQLNITDQNVTLNADSIQISGTVTTTGSGLCLSINPGSCSRQETSIPMAGGATLQIPGGDIGGTILIRPGVDLTLIGVGTGRTSPLPAGGNIVLNPGIVSVVPEPESYGMLFSGLLTVFGFAKRKKAVSLRA